MSDDPQPQGLTVLRRCGLRETWLRLVSDQAKPGEWESLPRREPRRARERLGSLQPKAEQRKKP